MTVLSTAHSGSERPFLKHGTVICVLLALGIIFVSPDPTRANSAEQLSVKKLRKNQTFRIDRTLTLNTNSKTIVVLLTHLEETSDVIRAWNLERYRAQPLGDGLYQVDDKAGLSGQLDRRSLTDTSVTLIGTGAYTGQYVPIMISGNAMASIQWKQRKKQSVKIEGVLFVQLHNQILHWIGKALFPLIKDLAIGKTNRLVSVANKLVDRIHNRPGETLQRLQKKNDQIHPDFKTFLLNQNPPSQ
ncbi:MAG: hypothetical protein ABEJ65_01505 [bacterium]